MGFYNEVGYSYGESGSKSGTVTVSVMSEYQDGAARQARKKTSLSTFQGLLAQTSSASTLVEKEKIIHDALARRLTWDNSDSMNKQSSASSLIGDTTVCAGYSAAFSVLMNALGAKTISITSDSHEWNEIYIGGNWYNVDVTYDDPMWNGGSNDLPNGENIQETYFNVSDKTLRADDYYAHIPDSYWESYGRPVCSVDAGDKVSNSGSGKVISGIGSGDNSETTGTEESSGDANGSDSEQSETTKNLSSYKVSVRPKSVTMRKGDWQGISYYVSAPSITSKIS